MLAFLIFAVFFVGSLIGLVFYLYPGSTRNTTIPGPDPSDPKHGNLGDVQKAGSLHQYLQSLHDQYGEIASFFWGSELVVSIATPELFKQHSKVFDRPALLFLMFEPMITQHSLQYANGADGRSRRKHYDQAFSHASILNYYQLFDDCSDKLCQKFSSMPPEEHIPLSEYMVLLALKIIGRVTFGDFFDDRNAAKIRHSYNICWTEMENRLSGDMPGAGDKRVANFEKELSVMVDLIKKSIEHRKNNDSSELLIIDTLMNSGLSDDVQYADALTYMVGGFHTTGYLLTWFFYYMCTHPDVEEKVLKELKTVLKGEGLSPSNRHDLKYLRQVIDETMRCSSLAPFAARVQDMDSELGGHIVPGKTPVIHALGVVLTDEKLWPNPEKFDPGRFDAEKSLSFAFKPFGFSGKRECPASGEFTYVEMMMIISILLPKFQFKLVAGQVVTKTYGLVTKPTEEIWVTVHKRK